VWLAAVLTMGAMTLAIHAAEVGVDQRHLDLSKAWHALPAPPITPYFAPFGDGARAFVGDWTKIPEVQKVYWDTQRLGKYDPAKDPRPINLELEAATIDDWKRMGYNCTYKGNLFSYRVGRFLKKNGMLGAIDQTLWGNWGLPPLSYDGKEGPRQHEGCGSFFVKANYDAGVQLLTNYVKNYGDLDMPKIGDYYITCGWDEVGMREGGWIDYRPEAIVEYRRYLKEVWFRDATPDTDTNKDGCTYNKFTGEHAATWDEVKPPILSPGYYRATQPVDEKWSRPGAYKLWIDFHRYFTFEFYRRTNAEASTKAGKQIECYPFPQAFIMWPGMDYAMGLSMYWNARLNPVLNNEQCWPDGPCMAINYAHTDHFARKYHNVIMGWSWFWFANKGERLYGPYDIERGLARMMGHSVDGIHHWLYSPQYRSKYQGQRLQLATWYNFLASHYATFLAKSAPPAPQVAVLMPDYTGYFYRQFTHPKMDHTYLSQGLTEAGIPYEIISEEELDLETDALKPYKLLCVVSSEWTTPTIRRRIEAFIARGGTVLVGTDALSLDITMGKRTDFLENVCGAKLTHKYKNPFSPSMQTAEEEAWGAELNGLGVLSLQGGGEIGGDVDKPGVFAKLWKAQDGQPVRDEEAWKKMDAVLAKLPAKGRGDLAQSAIDMRQVPRIKYLSETGAPDNLPAYGEIDVATVTKGKPIAWYGKDICGIETEHTVWLGTSPGMSLHALAPRKSMSQMTEPCNPFLTTVPDEYSGHQPYVNLLAYAVRKAGVKPVVSVTLHEHTPCNLEVLPRTDAVGNLLVFIINHDKTEATYHVAMDPEYVKKTLPRHATAWNLLKAEVIEKDTDGAFELAVPASRVAVVYVGSEKVLGPMRDAQANITRKDMSVPKYFLDHPELNTAEW